MSPSAEFATRLLSWATILGIPLALFLLAAIFRKNADAGAAGRLVKFLKERALLFSFLLALVSTIGSLFYSNIIGFAPCLLCWWQRIFLYPQVVILGVALSAKSKNWWQYTIPLSALGAATAAYNSYLQFGGNPLVPCSASGVASDCARVYFLEYGYVTIPTMALTVFALLILFGILAKVSE